MSLFHVSVDLNVMTKMTLFKLKFGKHFSRNANKSACWCNYSMTVRSGASDDVHIKLQSGETHELSNDIWCRMGLIWVFLQVLISSNDHTQWSLDILIRLLWGKNPKTSGERQFCRWSEEGGTTGKALVTQITTRFATGEQHAIHIKCCWWVSYESKRLSGSAPVSQE